MAVTKRKRNAPSAGPPSSSSVPLSAGPEEESSPEGSGPAVSKRLRRGRTREELELIREGKAYADAVNILEHLLADEFAYIFAKPVLEVWTEDEVPGYAEAVPNPMDLGTVMKQVKQLEYLHESKTGALEFDVVSFTEDMRRVFKNCMSYNDASSEYYRHARRLLVRTDRKYTQFQDVLKPARRSSVNVEDDHVSVAPSAEAPRRPGRPGRPRVSPSPCMEKPVAKVVKSSSAAAGAAGSAQITGSSVSSDEVGSGEVIGDASFIFVSTAGMEKKRGRKSGIVQDLETKHEKLTKRRKLLLQSAMKLEERKKEPMTIEEKASLCEKVAVLDFIRMKAVVDIIARGMNRQDILTESEVDMDINTIDNSVLREIQAFIGAAPVIAAHGTLEDVDKEIAGIEMDLVEIRFNRVS